MNALRRFIARLSQVEDIRSVNGTNFIGTSRELKESLADWNSSEFQHLFLQHNIKWTFNPPAASQDGGSWERLIRSIRKVLNSTVKEQLMDKESLHTVLCEAESIINSRPITKASNDPKMTSTCAASGDRYNTCPTCFGRDGSKNTCLNSKSASAGPQLLETSQKEMWFFSWMTVHREIHGLWERSPRLFPTKRVSFAEYG